MTAVSVASFGRNSCNFWAFAGNANRHNRMILFRTLIRFIYFIRYSVYTYNSLNGVDSGKGYPTEAMDITVLSCHEEIPHLGKYGYLTLGDMFAIFEESVQCAFGFVIVVANGEWTTGKDILALVTERWIDHLHPVEDSVEMFLFPLFIFFTSMTRSGVCPFTAHAIRHR
jgi:hypothetical protein